VGGGGRGGKGRRRELGEETDLPPDEFGLRVEGEGGGGHRGREDVIHVVWGEEGHFLSAKVCPLGLSARKCRKGT